MSVDKNTIEKMRLRYLDLFKGNDPFSEVFTEKILNRLLLCPTNGYFLTEQQFVALLMTMSALGESSFFVSEVEGEPDFTNLAGHWEISSETTYNEYCQLPVYLENALYSKSGLWAIIISHEEHALLGGTHGAVRLFKEDFPNWEQELAYFNQKWEYNQKEYGSEVNWIPKLLSHIQQNNKE